MEFIRYRKPTDSMNKNGMTKGVKTAPMKVMFKTGSNPYAEGQVLIVMFKQKQKVALVTGVNESSVTVQFDGVDKKKVIRYDNIVQVLHTVEKEQL